MNVLVCRNDNNSKKKKKHIWTVGIYKYVATMLKS